MLHELHPIQRWCVRLHLPEWFLAIVVVLCLGGCETFVHRLLLPNLFTGTTYIAMPFIHDNEIPLVPNSRPDGTKYTNLTIEQYQVYWKEAFPS